MFLPWTSSAEKLQAEHCTDLITSPHFRKWMISIGNKLLLLRKEVAVRYLRRIQEPVLPWWGIPSFGHPALCVCRLPRLSSHPLLFVSASPCSFKFYKQSCFSIRPWNKWQAVRKFLLKSALNLKERRLTTSEIPKFILSFLIGRLKINGNPKMPMLFRRDDYRQSCIFSVLLFSFLWSISVYIRDIYCPEKLIVTIAHRK